MTIKEAITKYDISESQLKRWIYIGYLTATKKDVDKVGRPCHEFSENDLIRKLKMKRNYKITNKSI